MAKILKRHKVQMTDERIKEIEYMLSLGISGNPISRYFGYDDRLVFSYITQKIIKDIRLKHRMRPSINEINNIMLLKQLLGKKIFSHHDMKKYFNQKERKVLYEYVKLWGCKLSKTKIEEKKNKHQMIEIGWFVDLYNTNETEKLAIDYFIEKEYDIWGLRHCGADFIIKKNGEYTLVEVKTTLSRNTSYMGMIQLLFGVDIIKKEFNIDITNKMLVYINIMPDNTGEKRYLNHFNIKTLCIIDS